MSDSYKVYASEEYVDEKIAEIPAGPAGLNGSFIHQFDYNYPRNGNDPWPFEAATNPAGRDVRIGDLLFDSGNIYQVSMLYDNGFIVNYIDDINGSKGVDGKDGATSAQVIAAMSKETWTFTLTDGTTVTKTVPLI